MKKTLLFAAFVLSLFIIISCAESSTPEVKHEHTWGERTVEKEATYTEKGLSVERCTTCDETREIIDDYKSIVGFWESDMYSKTIHDSPEGYSIN